MAVNARTLSDRDPLSSDGVLTAYLNEIGKISLLSVDEERRLFKRFSSLQRQRVAVVKQLQSNGVEVEQDRLLNDEDLEGGAAEAAKRFRQLTDGMRSLRWRIARGNLRLPVAIAKKYKSRGVDLPDLIQEGTLGLIHAIDKFDYRRGVRFGAYAGWWIQQRMGLAIATQGRTVRVPAYLQEWQRKLRQLRRDNSDSSVDGLAASSGLTQEQVKRAMDADSETISLDGNVNDDGRRPIAESIEDHRQNRPDVATESKIVREEIESVLTAFDDRTAKILRLRYGFDDGVSRSLNEVGREMKLSRERIRQIESAAFDRLRHPSRAARLRQFI